MKEKRKSENGLNAGEMQGMKGTLKYTVFQNGIPVEDVEERNLIVMSGRSQLARLLGGDVNGRSIEKISFGTNGTAALLADVNITNAYKKAITNVSYPQAGKVKFDWNLLVTEANGMDILEFGLVCADDTLFSRRIRESGKPINKEADISLEGSWTIEFYQGD